MREVVFFMRKLFNITIDETAFLKWEISEILYKNNFLEVSVKPFGFLHPQTPIGCIKYIVLAENLLERTPVFSEIAGSLLISTRKKAR